MSVTLPRLIPWFLLLSATACSGTLGTDPPDPLSQHELGTLGFSLLTESGIVLDEVDYRLDTNQGAAVQEGTIPLPNDDSAINGFIGAIDAGRYELALNATGHRGEDAVTCEGQSDEFTIVAGEDLELPPIDLVCTLGEFGADNTGSLHFSATVSLDDAGTAQDLVATFSVTPSAVVAHGNIAPPIVLTVEDTRPGVSYTWTSAPDGTFSFPSATSASGIYLCESNGVKTLTLTAAFGTLEVAKSVTVVCAGFVDTVICGDGVRSQGEECDDGNDVDNDGCHNNCTLPSTCGNGVLDTVEECDDGNQVDTDACRNDCTLPGECGDGVVDASEECDDGNQVDTDSCRNDCTAPAVCGNGVKEGSEECDDGNQVDTDSCRNDCTVPAVCGNGVKEGSEECDDGNNVDGDACSNTCVAAGPMTCAECINVSDPDIGGFHQTVCEGDSLCTATRDCVDQTGCFGGLNPSHLCYCGTNTSGDIVSVADCIAPTFVPTGVCAAQMIAGLGVDSPSNQTRLERQFNPAYPAGAAFAILTGSRDIAQCMIECNL